MEIESFQLKYEYFNEIGKNVRFNDQLADFYRQLFRDTEDDALEFRARNVSLCSKYLDFDYYRLQAVKAFRRINLCHDRFCPNCQGLLAKKREQKYTPVLDDLAEQYSLWHVVFTVPNVPADELKRTLDRMYKKFGYMMRYLKGTKKIAGLTFGRYGFAGAIRSLEISQNFSDNTFHPHFHCVFLLRKGLTLEKRHINQFSFQGARLERKFSGFEVTLQKIWYLLMNGIEVNQTSIATLQQGYSVIADPMEKGNYREIFKYAIKGCFKDNALYDYASFETLYYALRNRRVLQGYGELFRLNFEEDSILDEEADEQYDAFLAKLGELEEPVFTAESLDDVQEECLRGNVRYISKSSFKALFEKEKSPVGQTGEIGRAETGSSPPCLLPRWHNQVLL